MSQPGLKHLLWTKAQRSVFLIAMVCSLSLEPPSQAEGRDGISTNVRISATVQDVSIGEALQIVGALVGRPIEVSGVIGDRKISVNLQSVILEEALDRILYGANYVAVWSLDDRLLIHILDSPVADSETAAKPTVPTEVDSDEPLSLFPGDDEVLLPGYAGAHGLTARDIEYYASFRTPLDPSEDEVLPPDSPEDPGMTKEDLNFLMQFPVLSPGEVELVPPQDDAGFGLTTMAEFEAMLSTRPSLAPSQIEVVPPSEPGGIGMTLEQLQSITQVRPPHQPLTLHDMIPP